MCGLVGFRLNAPNAGALSPERALEALRHRGPDDRGTFSARNGQVFLGQARLSIFDLSPRGHQPMHTRSGRHVVVLNGEVYNFKDVRRDLERSGVEFRSNSDTEVVAEGYERYGPAVLEKFRGMFAMAVYGVDDDSLFLARDRLGVKPLYTYEDHRGVYFASEIRSLLALGAVPRRISHGGVRSFLAAGNLEQPLSIVEGVDMFPAATWQLRKAGRTQTERYWSLPLGLKPDASMEELSHELREAVRLRLEADVPVGVFLSSGVDSTAIAKIATEVGSAQVHTFTVVLRDPELNEGDEALESARLYGTSHHEAVLEIDSIASDVLSAVSAQDQPSIDGINTFLVSKAARHAGIKVALSGIGGDEAFFGYAAFRTFGRALQIRRALRGIPSSAFSRLVAYLPTSGLRKLGAISTLPSTASSLYRARRGLFMEAEVERLVGGSSQVQSDDDRQAIDDAWERGELGPEDAYGLLELNGYLRNMLLRDTDVMSMAHALEVREPLLDHRLLEVAFRMDGHAKAFGPVNKWTLVRAAGGLPARVTRRSKRGFGLPFDAWFAGPLCRFLDDSLLGDTRVVPKAEARRVLREYRTGRTSWSRPFALAVLEQYAERHRLS